MTAGSEVLFDMADVVCDELTQVGLDVNAVESLAVRVILRLSQDFGGETFYFPKGEALRRLGRDLAICTAHDGTRDGPNGTRALCRRYGVTEVHVYRILARNRRKKATARAQGATEASPLTLGYTASKG